MKRLSQTDEGNNKIVNLANGSASSDAAAFGQIPTALPPNGTAGGDLSGTYPNPTVAKISGIAVTGTPSTGWVPTATSSSAATWQAASSGFADPTTTKGDLIVHGSSTTRLAVGSDTQVLTADSTQTNGVKWAATAGGSKYIPQVLGATQARYYFGGYSSGIAATNSTVVANILYALPIFISQSCTATVIATDVETLVASSNARLGIYNDSSGLPGTLLLDAGTVVTSSVGTKTITGLTQALSVGQYWLAVIYDHTPGVKSHNTNGLLPTLGSTTTIGPSTTNYGAVSMSQTYGALPGTFSTTPTYLSAPPLPIVALQLT